MTTKDIYKNVRYDNNEKIDWWYFQVEAYLNGTNKLTNKVLNNTLLNKTWSLPPVVIEFELAKELGNRNYGKPIHLIEGTHRVSYINRYYELNLLGASYRHEFLFIDKK